MESVLIRCHLHVMPQLSVLWQLETELLIPWKQAQGAAKWSF